MKRILLIFSVLALIIVSCVETEPVSPVPEIKFTSLEVFYGYDSLLDNYRPVGELVFEFIDGDADFGLYQSDIIISDDDSIDWNRSNYNLIMTPYEKIDTNYYRVEYDTTEKPPPWYRLWHDSKLDRVGQNKTIKGTITVTLVDLPDYDTIRYDFYISDRAGNESNIESTSDVGTNIELPQQNDF